MYSFTTLFLVMTAVAQSSNAALVHQLANNGQCLTVANPNNGASVTLASCNSANVQQTPTGQQWVISPGNNQGVELYGSNLCLDAQSNPEAGRLALVYPCIGTTPQTWYLTPDGRIAITGGDQCLSVAGTNAETQRCGPSIDAQAFTPTFLFDDANASGSSTSTASSTNGIVGGGVGSVTSSIASATSSIASAGSSIASQASSAASSGSSALSSSVSSAVAAASQSASSVISSASASASSAIAGLSSSGASAATSSQSAATSGASAASSMAAGASSSATGALGSATSALLSAVSAATSAAAAVTSARSAGVSQLPSFGWPAVVSLFGIAIGAVML